MTDLVSTITGQFGKAWVLGALIPTVVFMTLLALVVQPLFPPAWGLFPTLDTLQTSDLILLPIAAIVLSGILHSASSIILQLYEGYPWREGTLGSALTREERHRRRDAIARWLGVRTLIRVLPPERRHSALALRRAAGVTVNRRYPTRDALVLPTRLGNTIRGPEVSTHTRWGLDNFVLWPHITTLMSSDETSQAENEKISLDLMLNTSFLLTLLTSLALFAGAWSPYLLSSVDQDFWRWLLTVIGLALTARVFYLGALDPAASWQNTVTAAIDVHRHELAEKLGYQGRVPAHAEHRFWLEVGQSMLFGEPPLGPAGSTDFRTFLMADPVGVDVGVTRSTSPPGNGAESAWAIHLDIRNRDTRRATGVTLTDTVPDGFELVQLPSADTGQDVPVFGTNPYRFVLGDIDPRSTVRCTYHIRARA